jgi:isopenicillin N synthase-like dioxygenase
MNSIPLIDVAPLLNGSSKEAHAVANALGHACREVGFFYITGHGVPASLSVRRFGCLVFGACAGA